MSTTPLAFTLQLRFVRAAGRWHASRQAGSNWTRSVLTASNASPLWSGSSHGAAGAPPCLEGDPSREPKDQKGDDRVEDPNHRNALAAPRERNLADRQQRQDERHHHAPSLEPRSHREQEQQDRPVEDDVAPAAVEIEAVAELVLGHRPRVGLVRGIEGAVAGRADLDEDRQKKQSGQIPVDGPQRLHAPNPSSVAGRTTRGVLGRRLALLHLEGVTAAARGGDVRVVDREAGLQALDPVDLGAGEVGRAERVDYDRHAVAVELVVAFLRAAVEAERVLEAGAAAALDGDPQDRGLAVRLLRHQTLDLRSRALRQRDEGD